MRFSIAAMRTIEAQIDAITEKLASAQLPDGYLNCWYIGREIDKRWTNLRDNHELYCAGHMLEGAIAYFQATGRRRLLDIMLRYVDHIATVFGPSEGQKRGYCGHQEIELALIKLYARDRRSEVTSTSPPISSTSAGACRTTSTSRRARAATIPKKLLGEDLRVQPVPQAGPRAGQGGRARGSRHVHVRGDGRPRRGARRRCS